MSNVHSLIDEQRRFSERRRILAEGMKNHRRQHNRCQTNQCFVQREMQRDMDDLDSEVRDWTERAEIELGR